jgi:hypothetical protein
VKRVYAPCSPSDREREKERERERDRQIKREKVGEREKEQKVQACSKRSSFCESVRMGDYYINWRDTL